MQPVRRGSKPSFYKAKGELGHEKLQNTQNHPGFSDDDDEIEGNRGFLPSAQYEFKEQTRPSTSTYTIDSFKNEVGMLQNTVSGHHPVNEKELLEKLHSRFKRKAAKWEIMSKKYQTVTFVLNFASLIFPVIQLVLKHLFKEQSNEIKEPVSTGTKKNMWQKFGIGGSVNQTIVNEWNFFPTDLTVEVIYFIISLSMTLLAGLQMQLKLREKAEKYKRGARAYARLLRMSSYYIMIIESGGKIDDITGLWREAMIRESTGVPCIRAINAL